MDSRNIRDSAFESVDVEENESDNVCNGVDETSLDLLEQQQAKEQARLLQRFRELRQWQQQQQEQLMQQQHLQLQMLKGEQFRVQTVIASQRGNQWGDGRVSRPEGLHKSPPLMTPPRRTGLGGELAKTMMAGLPPHISTDSGLVASMGDTLEQPKSSLPKPIMYPTSPSLADEDKYTNPELFSNPGSNGDDLRAIDDCFQPLDNRSEVGSDNFYLPPLPPDPKESQADMQSSLRTLQALMSTAAPNFLEQMLGLLPSQQKSLLLEQRQAAVQESASPSFSPVQPSVRHSVPLAPSRPPPSAFLGVGQGPRRPTPQQQSFIPLQNQAARPQRPLRDENSHNSQSQFHSVQPTAFLQSQHPGASLRHSQEFPSQPQHLGHSLPLHGQPHQAADPSSQQPRDQRQQHFAQHHHHPHPYSQHHPHHHQLLQQQQHQEQLQQQQHPHQKQQQQQSQQQYQQPDPRQHPFSQGYSQHRQFHSQPQSQAVSLPNHEPFEPHVRVRASWEEDTSEAYGRGNKGREKEEDEDEDDENLEVTVRQVVESPEDRPIRPGLQGKKTFQELMEEQLAGESKQGEEGQREAVSGKPPCPVKRPFLRKGQGIARFSQPIKRPPPKRSSGGSSRGGSGVKSSTGSAEPEKTVQQGKNSARHQPEKKPTNAGRKKMYEDEDPPQPEKLKLIKRRSETGKKQQQASRLQKAADLRQAPASCPGPREEAEDKDSIADDASFVAGLREREKRAPLEAEELDEFEVLEDIVDNMSLVSNSSAVQRLITPNKQRQKNAVSDLKKVMEKKKNAPSSPFERNAAIRSLLSVNVPSQPFCPAPETKQKSDNAVDENDDTLVEDDPSADLDPSTKGSKQKSVFRSSSPKEKVAESGDESDYGARGDNFQKDFQGDNFSNFGTWPGPSGKGLEFSSHFSLFDQHKPPSDSNPALEHPPSPTKSVTRKVATLQSRLSAANDTASLLQKLSAHAGLLSSGLAQPGKGKSAAKALDDEGDENDADRSLLSSSVSRPQPLLIGGGSEETSGRYFPGRRDSSSSEESDTAEENSDSDSGSVEDGEGQGGSGEAGQRRTQDAAGPVGSARDSDGAEEGNKNNNSHLNGANENENVDFDDEDEWMTDAPQATGNQASNRPASGAKDDSTPPTSKLMSRLFPKLKPKPTVGQQQQQERLQLATSSGVGDGVQSKVLREKLAELEVEIEKFRTENASLERLRREREEGLSKLKEEIARFDQEKTAELRRLEEFKQQESKKLKQERKLFDTYQKQVRAMPDKKEREEIEALKRQLNDLQDELKRKESRWSSSTTRLKTRVTELEGENAELREEVKLMERKRLEAMQSRGSSRPPFSQPSTALKSAPRSSTPTNDSIVISNGLDGKTASSVGSSHLRAPANPAVASTVVPGNPALPQVNGSGAGGKGITVTVGHQAPGGAESMPRGQPATPSMIDGVSPAAFGENADSGSYKPVMTPTPTSTAAELRQSYDRPSVDKGSGQYEETQYSDGKVERVYSNGSREVLFANGTRKEISSDGQYFIVSFFNGDIKQVFPDQRVVYYYAESQTTHTTYPDRLEVLQFPNNQMEKHYPDGTHEITFPNQTVKYLFPNGTEESIFQDGTILRIDKNGERILEFPNGQREVHTQQHKRREYPDGTVKTLHNDGRQETRYSTGRIRLKDKDGNVLLDRMY